MRKKSVKKPLSGRPPGELELSILKALWKAEELTGKEVWQEVKKERRVALTTVLTVLERLVNKGLIEKRKAEGLFIYRALISADEFTRGVSERLIRDYMDVAGTSLVAGFVDALESADPEFIERLYSFIEKKKKERKKR